MTPEQKRRDPEYAATAADKLADLQAIKEEKRRTDVQMALVDKLSQGGKVPFDQSMAMQAAGIPVPTQARGTSPDVAKQHIESVLAATAQDMVRMQNDPSAMLQKGGLATASYLEYVKGMGEQLLDQLARGRSPDEVIEEFNSIYQQEAINSGALAFWEMQYQNRDQTPEGK
jgi:hypothetical protein